MTVMTEDATRSQKKFHKGYPIVDCDVHQSESSPEAIIRRLPPFFRNRGLVLPNRAEYPNPHGGFRKDLDFAPGSRSDGSPEALARLHLDPCHIDAAILTGNMSHRVSGLPDADYAAAVARAFNDHLIEDWLDADERIFGSVTIATQDPVQAAAEIRRAGAHPRMVSVIASSTTRMLFGNRFYHPIFEAAEDMKLPVAVHPGGEGCAAAHAPTASGYPSTYLEWHTDMSQNYMAQVCSLVCEGVFAKFPGIKFIAIEGGISWLPHLMWRLDKNWKGLRDTVPWLTKAPSEYILEHVRLTTQPIEEPPHQRDLLDILRMVHAERTVMFSSDYPHWDFDDPDHCLRGLPEDLLKRIFFETARETYRWPEGVFNSVLDEQE